MMSFKQYLAAQPLEEGFMRSAALLAWSNKSKSDGDKSVAAFQAGKATTYARAK
jgi:hypothetical protein